MVVCWVISHAGTPKAWPIELSEPSDPFRMELATWQRAFYFVRFASQTSPANREDAICRHRHFIIGSRQSKQGSVRLSQRFYPNAGHAAGVQCGESVVIARGEAALSLRADGDEGGEDGTQGGAMSRYATRAWHWVIFLGPFRPDEERHVQVYLR
jgi:hypothetical protein